MIGGLGPAPGRLQHDLEVLLELGLAHELGQPPGTEGDFFGGFERVGTRRHWPAGLLLSHPLTLMRRWAGPGRCRIASRVGVGSPGSGQFAQGQLDLVLEVALGREASEGVADLVGTVAETGEGGAHLGPGHPGPRSARGSP